MKVYHGVADLNMENTELLPPIFPQKAQINGEKTMVLSRNNLEIVRQYACYCRTISMTLY